MSGDLISRSALLADIQAYVEEGGLGGMVAGALKRYVKRAPAVEAVPVRTGRWIERLDGDGEFVHHMCSECKADAIFQYITSGDYDEGMDGECYYIGEITIGIEEHLTNCCPNCGAKMEQEEDE